MRRIGTPWWGRPGLAVAAVGLLGGLLAAPADASNVAVGVSADPTQDTPVTVTVTGNATGPHKLWVFRNTRTSCESTADAERVRRGTEWVTTFNGDVVNGPFAQAYTFDADQRGAGTICAYVAEYLYSPPAAQAAEDYTVRAARSSVAIDAPSVVVDGQSITFTVTGTAEVARRLSVVRRAPSSPWPCGPRPTIQGGDDWLTSDGEQVHGDFSRSWTTAALRGPERAHQICVYLTRNVGSDDADAMIEHPIAVVPLPPPPPPPPPGPDPATFPPALLAPASGASGVVLNPTFGWESRDPQTDMLVISRRVGSQLRPLLATGNGKIAWLDGTGAKTQEEVRARLVRSRYATDTLASFTDTGRSVNVRLHEPLEPGAYAWQVFGDGFRRNQAERRPSEVREFTVIGPKLERLSVRTRSRAGASTTNPGETRIDIAVTHFSTVRVELRRAGRRLVRTVGVGSNTKVWLPVAWSCKKPGGTYRYRVEAWDTHGTLKATAGSFRPVSAARCRTMRNQERRAEAARQREVQRRAAKRRRAEAAAQRQRADRFKSNCGKLGGSPRLMRSGEGDYWVCVAPGGGALMYVPY